MLSAEFIGLNVHFASHVIMALACFAVFWLLLDAWNVRRTWLNAIKWLGFMSLSAGFLIAAATTPLSGSALATVGSYLIIGGLLAIAAGQLLDPLQKVPHISNEPLVESQHPRKRSARKQSAMIFPVGLAMPVASFATAGLAAICAILYWRRSHLGLERHLQPVAVAFGLLSISEMMGSLVSSDSMANPILEKLIATFGPIWWVSQLLLLASAMVLGTWVWQYLTKRLVTELFMTLVVQVITVFIVSTAGYTFLLLRDVKQTQLNDLSISNRVLQYSIASRGQEAVAQAQMVAALSTEAMSKSSVDQALLATVASPVFVQRGFHQLTVTDASGVVAWRADDPQRSGDSKSNDPLIRRALVGQSATSIQTLPGVTAPTIILAASSPIRNKQGIIIGAVIVSRAIDNAFVDALKAQTGLSTTVYGNNAIAATTITDSQNLQLTGLQETNQQIIQTVLHAGQPYSGDIWLHNRLYLASFTPLKDINDQSIGMLQAAIPADQIYQTAQRSLNVTLTTVVVLMVAFAVPIYVVSKKIANQLS